MKYILVIGQINISLTGDQSIPINHLHVFGLLYLMRKHSDLVIVSTVIFLLYFSGFTSG